MQGTLLISCNNLSGKRISKIIDTCICIIEWLCCTSETNTKLLINYAPDKIIFKRNCKLNFFKMIFGVVWAFPGGSDGKASVCNAGDPGSIPGSGRSPGEGNSSPLQQSCLGKSHGQRSPVGYSPWGRIELDTTKQLLFTWGSLKKQQFWNA